MPLLAFIFCLYFPFTLLPLRICGLIIRIFILFPLPDTCQTISHLSLFDLRSRCFPTQKFSRPLNVVQLICSRALDVQLVQISTDSSCIFHTAQKHLGRREGPKFDFSADGVLDICLNALKLCKNRYYFVIWERIIWRNIFLSVTKENFQDLVHFGV